MDLHSPDLYLNRELSWLEFNRRVLELARRPDVPLLERLKFVAIAASNLDEFYMVRVGGLERQLLGAPAVDPQADGWRTADLLREVTQRARALNEAIALAFLESLVPPLEEKGVQFLEYAALEVREREEVHGYYQREVHPCLTPMAIDPAHPFPLLKNNSLNIALRIEPEKSNGELKSGIGHPEGELLAVVQVPSVLPRFLALPRPGPGYRFVLLEDVIAVHAAELFPGHRILEARPFRVTRASDLDIAEDEVEDLLATIQDELRRRDRGEPVRLEMAARTSDELAESLSERLGVQPSMVDRHPGLIALSALHTVLKRLDIPELRDPEHAPVPSPQLRYAPTLFRTIAERDVLLHHPYETFRHVVDFVEKAAADPDVVAIKQTLYRTSGDSAIVRALARAAEAGKQVTALVELKARFDEANNIAWARALEQSGAHVVYGLIGLKTHAKILLVVRREGNDLRRYVHLSTGNYNPATARTYTDLCLFTAREDITSDAMLLFNLLTGYAELPQLQRLIVAPFNLRSHVLVMIEREIEHAKAGRPAGIRAKMNALADPEVIRALYRASQHRVPVDLSIRGICCLRPQVPGVSETIRVRALVDRFLEHARIFCWTNGGEDEVYLSSADWMPRNLDRRIEVSFPILDPALKKRITEEVLPTEFADDAFAWELRADGTYARVAAREGATPVRAQAAFIEQSRGRAPRFSVRPEVSGATSLAPAPSVPSPALRAAKAQSRRRRVE